MSSARIRQRVRALYMLLICCGSCCVLDSWALDPGSTRSFVTKHVTGQPPPPLAGHMTAADPKAQPQVAAAIHAFLTAFP
jgi:hypothetical protein